MPDGANKGSFVQGYNAQIAVDSEAQLIVAADLVQAPNDKQQLEPMLAQVERNVGLPEVTSADAGYWGEATIEHATSSALPERPSTTDWMRHKLRTVIAAALYRMRKAIVEPVFGQIKGVRGLRRLLLRGLSQARDEFRLIALTHNLLKLHRHAPRTVLAAAR